MAKNTSKTQKCSGGGTAQELLIYRGQRYHRETGELEQMATEAINTVKCLNYSLALAAIKTYRKAAEQHEEIEAWGAYYPAAVCFWAGLLEGARTERQKNRQKKKPLDAANIKRQALKILPTTRKSL